MSDGQKAGGAGTTIPSGESNQSVSYDSYQRSLSQLKSAKAKENALQERVNEMIAEREANEKATLSEQQRFKELYESGEVKLKESQVQLESFKTAESDRRKRDAVSALIGPVCKPQYLSFIDLSQVDMDNPDTISTEANRFRSEYPEALKTASASTHTNIAPGQTTFNPSNQSPKEMTDEQLDSSFSAGFKQGAF